VILSDLAKYPMIQSVARSLCDCWAFYLSLEEIMQLNVSHTEFGHSIALC